MRNPRTKLLVVLVLLIPTLIWAANQTINRVPSTTGSGAATYNSDMSTFLANEDANRQGELPLFPQGVIAQNGGGLHGTAASMTSPPFATTAYTSAGNRLAQGSASINYAGQTCASTGTAWVMASGQTAPTLGTFRKVPGLPYYTDCSTGGTTQPPLPPDSVFLMKVTLAGGQITAVQDIAVRSISSTADFCLAASRVVMPDIGDVVVDDRPGGVPVLGANDQRCQAVILNNGTADMRCAPTTLTVSATVGFPVKAGQAITLGIEGREAWRCVRTTGTTTAASIAETIRQ